MSDSRYHVASLSESALARVRGLESALGKPVVALEPAAPVAELTNRELLDLQHAEQELGVVLVAFEGRG